MDTVKNSAYFLSCECPKCRAKIRRGYEEETFFCRKCGQKLHAPAFTKEEIDNAIFEHVMDSYED